jgi:hypothetical protein
VKQAIKERGGAATASAHAAALMGSLSQAQDEETTAAVVYVLSHALGALPLNVLRAKFAPLADLVAATVERHPGSAAVARHGLQCAYVAIGAQEGAAWKTPQMARLVELTLAHAIDPRPKVRRAAQQNLVEFMGGEGDAGAAARGVLEARLVALCTSTFKACTSADAASSQQLLGMLCDVAPRLSRKALASVVAQVLKLLASASDRTMLAQLLSVLEALVAPEGDAGPGRGTVDQPVALPAATIAKARPAPRRPVRPAPAPAPAQRAHGGAAPAGGGSRDGQAAGAAGRGPRRRPRLPLAPPPRAREAPRRGPRRLRRASPARVRPGDG